MGDTTHSDPNFLAGVIEGFYGKPWTASERRELFDWMEASGLNTYLYAPKDDLKHRAIWREPYSPLEAKDLAELIQACQARKLRFIYALGPGLDIDYSAEADLDRLRQRLDQMIHLGCADFALLFDDIPERGADSIRRFGSLASAQCHVTNACFNWVRQRVPQARFAFCPTAYCGRMADRRFGGEGYLETVGRELSPEIDVFWTGPEIISLEITADHARKLASVLRRKPLLWDNLHANDYDGRRFFCGPYAGRSPELPAEVNGLLINPNCEFALNYVPIRTLGEFLRTPGQWSPREVYLSAMRDWLPRFETVHGPASLDDLLFLGDCYYLPHEEGALAKGFLELTRQLLTADPSRCQDAVSQWRQTAARLRRFCASLSDLRQRDLFYALNRRVWELREELDLLDGYIQFRFGRQDASAAFHSDFHLPRTYRGGMVAQLQALLTQNPGGSFQPAATVSQANSIHERAAQSL